MVCLPRSITVFARGTAPAGCLTWRSAPLLSVCGYHRAGESGKLGQKIDIVQLLRHIIRPLFAERGGSGSISRHGLRRIPASGASSGGPADRAGVKAQFNGNEKQVR